MNIPTAHELAEWRDLIEPGDQIVTMRLDEFERLLHAAELLLRVRDRAWPMWCSPSRDSSAFLYAIQGVDPKYRFLDDLRRADNDQSVVGSTCPGCHCVLYDEAAQRGWCRDCDPDRE